MVRKVLKDILRTHIQLITLIPKRAVPTDTLARGTVLMLAHDVREVTKADELLRENNELLRQMLAAVRKILQEMETMNEMTRKRLPYKWIIGEQDREERGN